MGGGEGLGLQWSLHRVKIGQKNGQKIGGNWHYYIRKNVPRNDLTLALNCLGMEIISKKYGPNIKITWV